MIFDPRRAPALGLMFLVVSLPIYGQQPNGPQSAASESRRHAITLQEAIETPEITELELSLDGEMAAFVVRQASLKTNTYSTALFMVRTGGAGTANRLLESQISQIRWMPDGTGITYVPSTHDLPQIWRFPLGGGAPKQITHHGTGVGLYAWSPDGRAVAFTSSPAIGTGSAELKGSATIYDDHIFSLRTFLSGAWTRPKPVELWIYTLADNKERAVPLDPSLAATINRMAWSPDGTRIAIEYRPLSGPDGLLNTSDIGIINLRSNGYTPVVQWKASADYQVSWSPDGGTIAFVSQGAPGGLDPRDHFYENNVSIYTLSLEDRKITSIAIPGRVHSIGGLWWDKNSRGLLFEADDRSTSTLYRLPFGEREPAQKVPYDSHHLSSIQLSHNRRTGVSVRQSITTPPEVASIDVMNGHTHELTALNRQAADLMGARELRWRNKYGYDANGFLFTPFPHEPGKWCPLLVILYGFSNKFSAQAQWITSYPVQAFVDHGFAVLLMNYPRELGWHYGDFARASLSQGYSPLATIESAVKMLIEMGIANPNRKGIMGWSFGSFLTEFTISHSYLFEAASAGEGGLNNPGQYWLLGDASMRYYLEGLFGGPPYGATYRNYLEFSPALNAAKVRAPLLREYGPVVGIQSLESYTALRYFEKPVEQVIYPNETHVFSEPLHRLRSMEINLDWFRFWLKGEEDPDPAKREQYSRWRSLRASRHR